LESVKFLNESLWIGNLGNVMVVMALIAALTSGWFYFQSANKKTEEFRNLGRKIFYIQAFSVVSIFVLLFSIIFLHKYEYYYAWRHSSNSLPVYYMISCFWEGQEGSFLLWMFWNAVLGIIVAKTAGEWESPVMAIICLAQVALATMLIGLKLNDSGTHIGSNPFDLLRIQKPEILAGIPMASGKAMYLKMITDGNGLNPLLQNYWMVIHPPTLFLGFASTLVPFAYSVAGLWMRKDRQWVNHAMVWSLVGVGILGGGIIMGGFWAYESLTFGGYWAWDPVENASLMPWLIMASGAHMLLITRSTGRHLFAAHLLIQLSFWLVLYATFLTRSGILGETSVHSFTDLKLSGQLLLFLFLFLLISLLVVIAKQKARNIVIGAFFGWITLLIFMAFVFNPETQKSLDGFLHYTNIVLFFSLMGAILLLLYKRTVKEGEDEKWTSRELWMFVGSMFLILSLVQVFSATSIPVFNKVFSGNTAVPKADAYNRVQIWLAMPVMLLMGIGQWFRYRETPKKDLFRILLRNGIISLVLGAILVFAFEIKEFKYILFLFLGVVLVTGNIMYFGRQKNMPWLGYGASTAHTGFGILLIGVLVSSVNQNVLTGTREGIDMANEMDRNGQVNTAGIKFNRENRILYLGEPVVLNGYEAMYRGTKRGEGVDSISNYFNILFVKRDDNGGIKDSFTLWPKTQKNPNMGLINEPSTRHYIYKDVFTHVNHESSMDRDEPFAGFKNDTISRGEKFLSNSGKIMLRLDSVSKHRFKSYLVLKFSVTAKNLTDSATLHPLYLRDTISNQEESVTDQSDEIGVLLKMGGVFTDQKNGTFQTLVAERSPRKKYVVLKAIVFPWINLVWAGTIIMVLGFAMAVVYRLKQLRSMKSP